MSMGMSAPQFNKPTLDESLQGVHDLKVAAMELLLDSYEITRETKMQIKDILDKAHIDKRFLLVQLSDYISKKNPKIFEVDILTKQGHEIGKSENIEALNLSPEEFALLEWYQQVRI